MDTALGRPGIMGLQLGISDRKDAILTGGLVLVIAAAISFTVYGAIRGRGDSFVFECAQCHRQFNVSRQDRECLANAAGPAGVVKACPRCSQKAARWANPCPACHKVVLRPADGICPVCGVNIPWFVNNRTAIRMGRPPLPPPEKGFTTPYGR